MKLMRSLPWSLVLFAASVFAMPSGECLEGKDSKAGHDDDVANAVNQWLKEQESRQARGK